MSNEITATQNGENLVKVNEKSMATRLRSFREKVLKGLTHVPFLKNVAFKILGRDKAKKTEENDLKTSSVDNSKATLDNNSQKATDNKGEDSTVVNQSSPATPNNPEDNLDQSNDHVDTNVSSNSQENEPTNSIRTITPKKIDTKKVLNDAALDCSIDLNLSPQAQNSKEENSTSTESKNDSENLSQNLSDIDTTELDNLIQKHKDLTAYETYKDYYNSFSEEERERKAEAGELLSKDSFIQIRSRQASEIVRINEAKEANRQAQIATLNSEEEERQAKKKQNIAEKQELEKRLQAIEKENQQIANESRTAKRTLNELNKESSKDKEETKKMQAIIDAHPVVKEANVNLNDSVDEIMKSINEKVYGSDKPKTEAEKANVVEPQIEPEKKQEISKLTNVLNQAAEEKQAKEQAEAPVTPENPQAEESVQTTNEDNSSIFDGLEDVLGEQATPENQNKEVVLESKNPDYPGTLVANSNGEVTPNWKNSPITQDNTNQNDFYMGFNPQTRAEVGQAALEKSRNSNGTISFEDALQQVASEYKQNENVQAKGKTR